MEIKVRSLIIQKYFSFDIFSFIVHFTLDQTGLPFLGYLVNSMETVWRQYGDSMETVWRQYGDSMETVWRVVLFMVTLIWRLSGKLIYHVFSMKAHTSLRHRTNPRHSCVCSLSPYNLQTNFTIKSP